jgi:hypothetical protein
MSGVIAPVLLRVPRLASPLGLDRHLRLCQVRSARLFELRCRADAVRGLFSGRPITTLALVLLAAALAAALT